MLEGVRQSGLSMTAEDYGKAVEAGQVTRTGTANRRGRRTDDEQRRRQAKLEAAVAEQIDALGQNLADESFRSSPRPLRPRSRL
ncbi:MAG: hypothetical protein ACLS7Z_10855 [Christensenellales bacterium]